MELKLNNITKKYGNFTAVNNVNLSLTPGVYGLLGPNGAGKTTMINMIVDILRPTSGTITLDGQEIHSMKENYRKLLGFLPQTSGVYPNFNGIEFLRYFAALKGIDKKVGNRIAHELMEKVNLGDAKKKKIKQYSGGMRQRLCIAQALIGNPKILIMDEPTVGLDPKERSSFLKLITTLAGDRIVLFSTHIVSDLDRIAEYIIFLRQGEVAESGKVNDVISNLNGKVFEINVSEDDYETIKQQLQVISMKRHEDRIIARIISDIKIENGVPVAPGLEDVYFSIFRDVGGSHDAFEI